MEYFLEEKHEEIIRLVEEVNKGVEIMRTGAQALREEGIEQGIEQGVQQGIQQGIQAGIQQEQEQIAKNMLSKGSEISFIADVTGLSREQVKKLQN